MPLDTEFTFPLVSSHLVQGHEHDGSSVFKPSQILGNMPISRLRSRAGALEMWKHIAMFLAHTQLSWMALVLIKIL
jgi:hypothetical protein